ncbi:hypothetical protein AB0N06_16460 [Streptomyces sp. NPDC051020]|uniref:hypothetical protein n=1 Tax=Streptomyces sp. NPDC051020 TaxID=3155409 RepID=UPI0034454587
MMSSHMVDSSPFGGWAADHAVSLVELDGETLPVADAVRMARGAARPVPCAGAMKRVDRSWAAARELAATGRVYGRSTGVGANRHEEAPTEAADALEQVLAIEINAAAENPLICVCGAYRQIVACELVATVRALLLRELRPDPGLPVGRAFELADSLLEGELADRPLTDDVKAAAGELLDRCTDLWNTDLTSTSTSTRGTV